MAVHELPHVSPRRNLLLAFVAFFIALALWQFQGLVFLTYPLRLFVTMIHELGHGTSAVLTGGDFLGFEVKPGGAGLALTAGGSRFIVIQAGYLGTALFGAALLFATNHTRHPGRIAVGMGFLIGLLTLLYAGISLDNLSLFETLVSLVVAGGAIYLILTQDTDSGRYGGLAVLALSGLMLLIFTNRNNTLTALVGLGSALVLVYIGFRGSRNLVLVTLYFLAFLTGLQAITDAWILLKIVTLPRSMMPLNDASSMAREFGGVAAFWALLWIALDVLIVGSSAYFTLIKPVREGKILPPETAVEQL